MIKNEDTYCIVQHKIVREIGAYEAVVYGTITNLLRKTDGIGEVSNQTIMDLCGITNKMSLKRYIDKLIKAGYLEKRSGDGRGNISIYYITKKGNNLLPFNEKKGNKNDTERVTKMSEKGNNLLPINKDINKEYKESGDDMREAQSHTLFTTTTFFDEIKEFSEWWEKCNWGSNWSWRKEECADVWKKMAADLRGKLLELARAGMKWRMRDNDDPFWYLKNYRGRNIMVELPYIKQGTPECTAWLNDANRDYKKVIIIRYEGSIVYCYAKDWSTMEAAGAEFVNYFNF